MDYWAYEYAYKTGGSRSPRLVNDLEIPNDGLLNGPGPHRDRLRLHLTPAAEGGDESSTCTMTSASWPATASTTASRNYCSALARRVARFTGEAIPAGRRSSGHGQRGSCRGMT